MIMKNLINRHEGKTFLIICTGKTLSEEAVEAVYSSGKVITIAINKVPDYAKPDYHLFVNNDRIKTFLETKHPESTLLIGSHIKKENRPNIEYIEIPYTDRDVSEPMGYDGTIRGYYRVSGTLAIMISHLMGAKNVYIAGMNGFMYQWNEHIHYYKDDRDNKNNNKSYEEWLERYDKPIIKVLNNLKTYGIDFKIITPTIYEDHYENTFCLPE